MLSLYYDMIHKICIDKRTLTFQMRKQLNEVELHKQTDKLTHTQQLDISGQKWTQVDTSGHKLTLVDTSGQY